MLEREAQFQLAMMANVDDLKVECQEQHQFLIRVIDEKLLDRFGRSGHCVHEQL